MKLFDAELKVMEVLWKEGDLTAKQLAEILGAQIGWGKTTTYTMIKRCIDKGAISRREPNFVCHPLISVEEAREYEVNELIDKMYSGSADQLVASLLDRRALSKEEIQRLKLLVNEME